ncbi:MAG: hypothetical protein RR840_08505 [Clostridium sp.]
MRFIKFLVITLIVLGVVGYGAYHFGTKFASDKMVKTMYTELEKSGELKNIKSAIENDKELKSFIEGAKSVDSSKLPFTTKEEATKFLVKKLGINGLNDIRVKLQDGKATKEEVLKEIEGKLSNEEINALKVIAYKELYK